jgi:Ferric reductase NAD binding domain
MATATQQATRIRRQSNSHRWRVRGRILVPIARKHPARCHQYSRSLHHHSCPALYLGLLDRWRTRTSSGVSHLKPKIKVEIHVTDNTSSPQSTELSPDEASEKTALRRADHVVSRHKNIAVKQGKGRPNLKELVRKNTMDAAMGTSVAVAACGPASMGLDVKNACVEAQRRILRGKGGAREVWFHTGAFGW